MHRVVDGMDISTIEIHLEGRTTDSGDDSILREACLEVGISEKTSYDRIPDFSTFDIIGYLDLLIVITDVHFFYDDTAIFSNTSDTAIWPYHSRTRALVCLDSISCDESIVISATHIDSLLATYHRRGSLIHCKCRGDRIIGMDHLIVSICRYTDHTSYTDHQDKKCDEKYAKIHERRD